jgi:hypothetical protein
MYGRDKEKEEKLLRMRIRKKSFPVEFRRTFPLDTKMPVEVSTGSLEC